MAIRTYLYRAAGVVDADLVPLLAGGAGAVVGAPLNETLLPITVDDSHKADLDDAMASLNYEFDSEYTDPAAILPRRDYGVLAIDPTGTTPGAGDYYYNSSLQMEMTFDSLRSKWLSVESAEFVFGREGNTNTDQFYRTIDGRVMSATQGWLAIRSGTIISLGYTRVDSDAATFQLVSDGSTIASVASSATSGRDVTLDADFSFNEVLAARNASGGNVTSNVVAWMRVKWRV